MTPSEAAKASRRTGTRMGLAQTLYAILPSNVQCGSESTRRRVRSSGSARCSIHLGLKRWPSSEYVSF